jgi:hypothetical protein
MAQTEAITNIESMPLSESVRVKTYLLQIKVHPWPGRVMRQLAFEATS